MYNYHTHTLYCDGTDKPEAYCEYALSHGIEHLGFSGHAWVDVPNQWSIRQGMTKQYLEHLLQCRKKFPKLTVLAGLEADYIPGRSIDFREYSPMGFEYIIGSIHLVKSPLSDDLWFIDGPAIGYDEGLRNLFNNDIEAAVSSYFSQTREMLLTQKPDILGHMDKIRMHNRNRFFSTDEFWYKEQIQKTLEVAAQTSVIIELNTRGRYKGKSSDFFPSPEVLQWCREIGLKIVISSDAHKPEELCLLHREAAESLLHAGYTSAMRWSVMGWEEYDLG